MNLATSSLCGSDIHILFIQIELEFVNSGPSEQNNNQLHAQTQSKNDAKSWIRTRDTLVRSECNS